MSSQQKYPGRQYSNRQRQDKRSAPQPGVKLFFQRLFDISCFFHPIATLSQRNLSLCHQQPEYSLKRQHGYGKNSPGHRR